MPRLTFDITPEVHKKLSLIPYGSRKKVMVMIVENLARLIEADRVAVLSKLISQTLTLEEMMGTADE